MQQFILKYLYYKTSIQSIIEYNYIPWIGFICALILSIITTHYLLRTKIGKFLIG